MRDVTLILERAPKAVEELLPLVYDELRRLAAARMAGQPEENPCGWHAPRRDLAAPPPPARRTPKDASNPATA